VRPDFFKCVDLLMVAFVVLAWSQPIWRHL